MMLERPYPDSLAPLFLVGHVFGTLLIRLSERN